MELSFKHGYKDAMYDSNPKGLPDHSGQAQWNHIENAPDFSESFSLGAILDGKFPELYEWDKKGHITVYTDHWVMTYDRYGREAGISES